MQRVKASENLKQLTLLYVEDEEAIREPFLQLIGRYFKQVYVATNGEEGFELFNAHKDEIDIIISDIRMPKKDGLTMAKEIKEINSDIPIVFSTAFGDNDYLQQAIEVGSDGYIIKPIDRNKLISKLNYISKSVIAKKRTEEYMKLIDTLINYQKTGVVLLDENFKILIMNKTLQSIIENLGIKDYKEIDDLLVYCYDENNEHIDSQRLLNSPDKTIICQGKKTGKYYELDIQKVDTYYIINVDDISEYKQKENAIQENMMIDELTQIYNRKKLDVLKSQIVGNNLCLIIFDIDNFKKINDTYGHLKGDEVLKSLANVVKNNLRASDIVIRWGGEEFLVILQNQQDIEISAKLAEKLRNKINEIEIEEVGHFSCSFGVACGFVSKENDIDKILNYADEALYSAKRNGKNRVEVS